MDRDTVKSSDDAIALPFLHGVVRDQAALAIPRGLLSLFVATAIVTQLCTLASLVITDLLTLE
jgi:hypothetical protein